MFWFPLSSHHCCHSKHCPVLHRSCTSLISQIYVSVFFSSLTSQNLTFPPLMLNRAEFSLNFPPSHLLRTRAVILGLLERSTDKTLFLKDKNIFYFLNLFKKDEICLAGRTVVTFFPNPSKPGRASLWHIVTKPIGV